jgi:hypothetical protein
VCLLKCPVALSSEVPGNIHRNFQTLQGLRSIPYRQANIELEIFGMHESFVFHLYRSIPAVTLVRLGFPNGKGMPPALVPLGCIHAYRLICCHASSKRFSLHSSCCRTAAFLASPPPANAFQPWLFVGLCYSHQPVNHRLQVEVPRIFFKLHVSHQCPDNK